MSEGAPTLPEFELVRRFGIEVYDVPGLRDEVVYVPEVPVAFIRAGLCRPDRREVAEWVLCEALRDAASRCP